ncbi:MAG: hypothetical protein WCU88_06700 [Elusimicrobiota bacterium]|jgi:hypothetical protein
MHVHSSGGDPIFLAFAGLGAGPYFFWKGFRELRLKRIVEAISTSEIHSMAMGTVELMGTASPVNPDTDPIFGLPCTCYRIEVEEQRGSGKSRRWVQVHLADTTHLPFWISDGTGRALVIPADADIRYKTDLAYTTGMFSQNGPASAYIQKVAGASSWTARRVKASIVRPEDPFYVLGSACPPNAPPSLRERISRRVEARLPEALRKLKADPARMKAADTTQDGQIDGFEWDRAVEKLKEDLARSAQSEFDSSPEQSCAPAPVIIKRGDDGLLVLADQSEKALVSTLAWKSLAFVLLGPLATLASIAYLCSRFHWP